MNAFEGDGRTQLQIARGEIDGWRGQCMDLFARSERTIALTLEHAILQGRSAKLKHLAGQRLADLETIISTEVATPSQSKALAAAISKWHEVEENRVYLAHGVLEELLGSQGRWWAIFDVTIYEKKRGEARRWAVSKDEADLFQSQLAQAFRALSSQLGQLRGRMAACN